MTGLAWDDSLALQQDKRVVMPWKETDRAKYAVIAERYATDLSDDEYALVAPLLPPAKRRGPKPTDAREMAGKKAAPSVVIVDSQSVMTSEAGGPRGCDAAKKINGRKRYVAVETLGLPIKCQVTPADVQDRDALPDLLAAVSRKSPWVRLALVDGAYAGDETAWATFEASRSGLD